FQGDLPAIEAQARAAGADFDSPSPHKDAVGIWYHDPDGNLVQVKEGPRTMPTSKAPFHVPVAGADQRGAHARAECGPVRPRRLSHVLLFAPDVLRAVKFYGDAVGVRLSDKSLDVLAFTHAPH